MPNVTAQVDKDDSLLSGRELDAAIAERVMGWKRIPSQSVFAHYMYQPPDRVQCFPSSVPLYSSSIEAATKVEDRIKELGLKAEYIKALWAEVDAGSLSSVLLISWRVIRASPEQRCRAALSAIE